MTLANLIRKRDTGNLATAIPAIAATQPKAPTATVARIATVAVANPKEGQAAPLARRQPSAPLTAKDETAIRSWLAQIEEADPATIAEVIGQCQRDADARDYFTGRAAADSFQKNEGNAASDDDRRTCPQCANLIARRCHAAKRGEIVASRDYEPIRDLPRRCEGYAPGPDDPDRRPGRERWPGLIQQGGE